MPSWPRWLPENRTLGLIQIALALGGTTVIVGILRAVADLPSLVLVGIVLISLALSFLLAHYLVPSLPSRGGVRSGQSVVEPRAQLSRDRRYWKPRTEVFNEGKSLMVDLVNSTGPEITGALAVDVENPSGGPPHRYIHGPGIRTRAYCVYPEQFTQGISGIWPGLYRIRWYEWHEVDDDWEWIEIARDELEVPRAEPGKAFQ
jgi:hypothetical protein